MYYHYNLRDSQPDQTWDLFKGIIGNSFKSTIYDVPMDNNKK